MNKSPQNKPFADVCCLSLEQMKRYQLGALSASEKHSVEDHLLDCELCSEALAGFALIPVTAADINEVNKKIDHASGLQHASVFGSKLLLTAAAAIMLSVSLYFVYHSFSKNEKTVAEVKPLSKPAEMFSTGEPPKNTIVLDNKNTEVKELLKHEHAGEKNEKAEEMHPNEAFTMEMLETKKTDVIFSDKKDPLSEENMRVPVLLLGNDTFILDLKITDYDKYYFVNLNNLKPLRQGTDPMFENKNDENNNGVYKLQEWEVTTTAQVLHSALVKFNAQQYADALKLFNVLAAHDANDVNALFYGGVCYFNLNNADKALDDFTRVMGSANGSFYEEAKWYKALCFLKKHDTDNARKLFAEIVSDNGFYKEQAIEKLKGL